MDVGKKSKKKSQIIVEKYIQAIEKYIDEGNNDRALDVINNLRKDRPSEETYKKTQKFLDIIRDDVTELFNHEDYENSIPYLNKLIESDIKNIADYFYFLRGCCYSYTEKSYEAIKDYKKAIDMNPAEENYYLELGLQYLYENDKFNSIVTFNKLVNLNPTDIFYHFERGLAHLNFNNYSQASTDFIFYLENYQKNFLSFFIELIKESHSNNLEHYLISEEAQCLWEKDLVFIDIIGKEKQNLKEYKKIWYYQTLILNNLKLSDNTNISHYTTFDTLKKLISLDESMFDPSDMRMFSLTSANDPLEGKNLLNIFKSKNIAVTDEYKKLVALQSSFSKNLDSLTMFRLYGKTDNIESSGICLVFNSNFFAEFSEPCKKETEKKYKKKERSNYLPQLKPLFHVLYYDKQNNEIILNRKTTKHGQNIIISLNNNDITEEITITDIVKIKDDKQYFEYCINNIFKLIKECENKQICYDLLINLKYLIKSDDWIEETELRLLEILPIDNENIRTMDNDILYQDYLDILGNPAIPHLKEIILGSKIENVESKAEVIRRHLLKNNFDIKVSVSEAPIN